MSPTVLIYRQFRFYFYSNEENRKHIHVDSGGKAAKFWLEPEIELAWQFKMLPKDIKQITKILTKHKDECINAWNARFSQ